MFWIGCSTTAVQQETTGTGNCVTATAGRTGAWTTWQIWHGVVEEAAS